MSFEKGKFVWAVDRKDGRKYKCKIVQVKDELIKIHYHGWNSSHDEWIEKSSERLLGEVCGDFGSSQGSQSLNDSVQSAERLIDSLSEVVSAREATISDAATNAGTANVDSPEIIQGDSVSGLARKRVRGSESPGDGCGGGPRKRLSVDVGGGLAMVDFVGSRSVGAAGDGPSAGGGMAAEGGLNTSSATLRYVSDASNTSVGGSTLTDAGAVQGESGACVADCKLCLLPITGRFVECEGCKAGFHPDTLCLGIEDREISVLLDNTNGALVYKCCLCRSGKSGATGAFNQLLKMVGVLAQGFKKSGFRSVGNTVSSSRVESAGEAVSRVEVMSHLRELREREKRSNSIMLRGLQTASTSAARDIFRKICDLLDVGIVELSEMVRVGPNNLFRATVINADLRREVLMRSHELRRSDNFARVYVDRDLTYQQRQEVLAKRRAVRQSHVGDSSNANGGPLETILSVIRGQGDNLPSRNLATSDHQQRVDRSCSGSRNRYDVVGRSSRSRGNMRGRGNGRGSGNLRDDYNTRDGEGSGSSREESFRGRGSFGNGGIGDGSGWIRVANREGNGGRRNSQGMQGSGSVYRTHSGGLGSNIRSNVGNARHITRNLN